MKTKDFISSPIGTVFVWGDELLGGKLLPGYYFRWTIEVKVSETKTLVVESNCGFEQGKEANYNIEGIELKGMEIATDDIQGMY